MRDYIKAWTTIMYDADPFPTGQTRAGFFRMSKGMPKDAQTWIDVYKLFGGYTDPQLSLNEPRWYGWDIDALLKAMNSAYFVGANYSPFIDGSQGLYPPKSGSIDIFKYSPRGAGFNSLTEEPRARK
jgi:hypothetical protein